MKLSDSEILILNKLFDGSERELNKNYIPVIAPKENYAKYRELVYHLDNLERYELVKINYNSSGKYYSYGGRISEIYKNAAISAPYWTEIALASKGIEYIEDLRLSKLKKIFLYINKKIALFFDKLIDNLIEVGFAFITGVLVGNIDRIIELVKNIIK